jgi:hypothetical protein
MIDFLFDTVTGILIFFLNNLGTIVLCFVLAAVAWFLWKSRREFKSFRASAGDADALAMEKTRLKAQLLVILAVVPGIAVFTGVTVAGLDPRIGGVMGVIVAGVILLWAGALRQKYNAWFKDNFVRSELEKVFSNVQYEPRNAFDSAEIFGLDFFRDADLIGGNDLIVADYEGRHFSRADLRVEDEYTVTVSDDDGESHEETRRRTVFQGQALRFEATDPWRGPVRVVSRDFENANVKDNRAWQTVQVELAEFAAHFTVYARDPLDAMAILTPQMIEGIFYLRKALSFPMGLYFTGNKMYAFLATGREAFDTTGKKTLLEEKQYLQRDIALIQGFLSVMYFKGQGDGATPEERLAAAQAIAENAGPAPGERILKETGRIARKSVGIAGKILTWGVIAVYVVTAVILFIRCPDGVIAGNTESAMTVPTLAYVAVGAVFIVPAAFANARWFSLILLGLHLVFFAFNLRM